MNNILDDVNELKDLIISSKEYTDYINSMKKVDSNEEIKKIIKDIIKLQKQEVNLNNKNIYNDLDIEINNLYDRLNSIPEYTDYINSSRRLNILITSIQEKFKEFFDSLVC